MNEMYDFKQKLKCEKLGRLFPPQHYLASSDSRYVTGQTLHVNGGVYCG